MSTTWTPQPRTGGEYEYNQSGYAYNQDTDPTNNQNVAYNGLGSTSSWTAQTRT